MPSSLVIGLDIGGSKTLAGLVARDGEIQRTLQVATSASAPAILASARALCERLIKSAEAPVAAIGIGSAGMVDTASGIVLFANENIPGWTGARLRDIAVAGLPVAAENDARALAYGEAVLGAGRERDSLLCVTVGTGIGGAIIANGSIWHGANFSAGEIGYLVVGWDEDKALILDQYCSGPAIERSYQIAKDLDERLPLTEINRRARCGDDKARSVINKKAKDFGAILAGIVAAINPDAVVIGGGVPQVGALWWDACIASFRAAAPQPVKSTPLLPAALGAEAVMLGAAMLAWRICLSQKTAGARMGDCSSI